MKLSELRKKRKSVEQLANSLTSKRDKDDRFWQAQRDKQGNSSTVIRFLPQKDLDADPFTLYHNHFFQDANSGKYFVEQCPTTLGDPCPVCENNSSYWKEANGDHEQVPKEVKARSRKNNYVSNILVIKDPSNPENEGKVFLFKFGKSIFDKIKESISPEFEDQMAINPFDLWEGAKFNFRITKKGDWANYDKSSFDSPSELFDGDEDKLQSLLDQVFDLKEFKYEDETKSYEELQKKFYEVTGEGELNEESPAPDESLKVRIDEAKELITEESEGTPEPESDISEEAVAKFDKYFDS